MLKHKFAVLASIPVLWSAVAFAQTTPPANAPQAAPNPAVMHQAMCTDHYAHDAAMLTFLENKLQLTDKQKPVWAKFQQAKLDAAGKERDACLSATPPAAGTWPTAPEREARIEKMLSLKLQSLEATRPALQALYEVLTPEQKQIVDHPHHGHHGMMDHHFGPGHGMEGPGGWGHGPQE